MKQGIALLEQLGSADTEWILATAAERDVAAGEVLIEAGAEVDALHVVTQGLLGVLADEAGTQLAVLGPGDLAGEMSFLTAEVPTETVRALEGSRTLAVPYAALRARGAQDSAFSARLHRAFAELLAGRLRDANRRLSVTADRGALARQEPTAWLRLREPLEDFKRAALAATDAAATNDDEVPEGLAREIVDQFLGYCELLHAVLSQDVENERVREELGLRLQQELLPYILLTEAAERSYRKPRGYAGDFWTIELLYRNQPACETPLGELVDRCFLKIPAARALRNRRGLVAEEIEQAMQRCGDRPAQATSLACGPAREMFDAFSALADPSELQATLLDIDHEALAFVAGQARDRGLDERISVVEGNLVRLALGKAETDIRDQDLVYSVGLIDYFGDDLVVRLMDLVHTMLRPGGRVLLGNFHPRHPSRELMDHVLDWKLIHRTEEDMDRLYERSAFGRPCTKVRFEEEGINLFAECVR